MALSLKALFFFIWLYIPIKIKGIMKKISIMAAMSLCIIGCLIIASEHYQQEVVCKDGVCLIKKDESTSVITNVEKIVNQEDAVIEVTLDNFDAVVKTATKLVVVDFYATWCQPCKYIKPIFSELAQEEKDWIFAAIDVDKAPAITTSCGVQAMPTFVVFKDGVQWGSVKGILPKDQLMVEFKKIANRSLPASCTQADQIQQLIMAICQSNNDEIKKLLADGVDINGFWQRPEGNFYPLQMAIVSGKEEIIDLLISSGAIMNKVVEESIKKQIESSMKMGEEIQQCLDYVQNKIKALPESVNQIVKVNELELRQRFMMAMGDPGALKDLINEGADINMVFEFGNSEATPLYLAIMLNNKIAIDILIDAGASLDIEITNEHGDKKTIENMIKEAIGDCSQGIIKARKQLAYTLNKITS